MKHSAAVAGWTTIGGVVGGTGGVGAGTGAADALATVFLARGMTIPFS